MNYELVRFERRQVMGSVDNTNQLQAELVELKKFTHQPNFLSLSEVILKCMSYLSPTQSRGKFRIFSQNCSGTYSIIFAKTGNNYNFISLCNPFSIHSFTGMVFNNVQINFLARV